MAKLEYELEGDFGAVLARIEHAVLNGSLSASKEDASDFSIGECRCAVRVYERYSAFGGNRVSMNVTLLQTQGRLFLSAITSGGSQAMFLKMNTLGEESFLDTLRGALDG